MHKKFVKMIRVFMDDIAAVETTLWRYSTQNAGDLLFAQDVLDSQSMMTSPFIWTSHVRIPARLRSWSFSMSLFRLIIWKEEYYSSLVVSFSLKMMKIERDLVYDGEGGGIDKGNEREKGWQSEVRWSQIFWKRPWRLFGSMIDSTQRKENRWNSD